MSCAVSCNTDSGARNPAMVATLVAAGGGGVRGGGAGDTWTAVESAGVPGVWDADGLLTAGSQAAPAASSAHTTLRLMRPSPPPSLSCASRSACGPPPPALPGRRGISTGTSPGRVSASAARLRRSEEHTSELQSQSNLVCRLLLEKKKKRTITRL